ncbi:MAG: hypothetical protein SVN78_04865 [Deferribacterota bacterium]|nr:hypothetical protein [Deferribacterota bacterium]
MQLLKLTEEQIKNISSTMVLQRAENYIGRFFDCEFDGSTIRGKIKGNHGVYNVELKIDTDPLEYKCDCKTAQKMFCKHAAALGLTYIYTPWMFTSTAKIDKEDIKTLKDLEIYLCSIKLKNLVEELKRKGIEVSKLVELTGIPVQQIFSIVKDDQNGRNHILTKPLKLAFLYLLEKELNN